MGQRSVERPSRVSTRLRGFSVVVLSEDAGYGNGAAVGALDAFGDVPRERAAMTS